MSKRANPALVGGFVLGAVLLVVAGVVLFGSGKLFKDIGQYVLFFEGNVAGLHIGAPVTFRGVKIGAVSKVQIQYDPDSGAMRIPVIIEVDYTTIKKTAGKLSEEQKNMVVEEMVARGLRAQLKLQSLVTGLLSVELDFHPDKPARFVTKEQETDAPELPTIPSDIEMFQQTLEKLPIDTMMAKAIGALEGIERVVNSPQTVSALASLSKTLEDVETLVEDLNRKLPDITQNLDRVVLDARKVMGNADDTLLSVRKDLSETLSAIAQAVSDLRGLVRRTDDFVLHIDQKAAPMLSGIGKAAESAQTALSQAGAAFKSFETITSKDAALGYQIFNTLDELSAAARSVRILAEYLERHPEALVRGKEGK